MANSIAIVGDSGTGKSSSMGQLPELNIEGLNPEETFIINVKGKPLPFRGWKAKYNECDVSNGPPVTGNYVSTTDSTLIIRVLTYISQNRPDIKNVILDDGQYIMSEEFMANALKAGYDKFNKMAKNMYDVVNTGINMRSDINFILMIHEDEEEGKTKIKTLGKMLDDKVNLAGLFTVVLYTVTKTNMQGTTYHFATNKQLDDRGIHVMAKSPVGMFTEKLIPNDLGKVIKTINEYNDG